MSDLSLAQLTQAHASAKKKMILGIIFTAVAYLFTMVGILTTYSGVGVVLIILSLPFYGVGIPFLIKGIIGTTKTNRQIALARTAEPKSPMFCRKCGTKLLPDSVFCMKCGTKVQMLFCRICGRKLLSDSAFCDGCGASVVAIEAPVPPVTDDVSKTVVIPTSSAVVPTLDDPVADPQDIEIAPADTTSETKQKKKIWRIIVPILTVIILACTAFFIVPKLIPVAVEERDINSINGCPEFYNIQFGMTAQQASALVEIEHKAITGYENSFGSMDSSLYLQEGTEYDVYGLPTSHVLCCFDRLKLDTILFVFPKEDVSLSEVVDLYTKIYGESTTRSTLSATWSGAQTTIDVFDTLLTDGEDEEIIVRYRETPNKQFKNLTFDGPEYDPCNFLTTQIFKKKPSYYTSGLVSGDDFNVDKNDYFTKYTLYPRFEYMGIEEGMTAISFDVDASETEISVCSYLFLLEKDEAADQLTYIKSVLENEYGTYSSCTYTSMKYDELGIVDLTFTEFILRIKSGTQGQYNIQWDMGFNKVTINFTVDPSKAYYEGSVSTFG